MELEDSADLDLKDMREAHSIISQQAPRNLYSHGTNGKALEQIVHYTDGMLLSLNALGERGLQIYSGEAFGRLVPACISVIRFYAFKNGNLQTLLAIDYANKTANFTGLKPSNIEFHIKEAQDFLQFLGERRPDPSSFMGRARYTAEQTLPIFKELKKRLDGMPDGERNKWEYSASIPILIVVESNEPELPIQSDIGGEVLIPSAETRIIATESRYIPEIREMVSLSRLAIPIISFDFLLQTQRDYMRSQRWVD